ncbi:MAG: CHASE2 domain-containing protein [Acidobacteria bacterium]|nr:CHASE2 domain-containing protein [Acidobacteriota bacterium]
MCQTAAGVLLGLGAAAIVLGLAAAAAFDDLELDLYDWRMRTAVSQPPDVNPDIIIVELNDTTIRDLAPVFGRWPWPRAALSLLDESPRLLRSSSRWSWRSNMAPRNPGYLAIDPIRAEYGVIAKPRTAIVGTSGLLSGAESSGASRRPGWSRKVARPVFSKSDMSRRRSRFNGRSPEGIWPTCCPNSKAEEMNRAA